MLKHLIVLVILFVICKIEANDSSFGNFNLNQTEKFVAFQHSTQEFDRSPNNSSEVKLRRTKRGIFQLGGIIKCVTGCKPLSYNRYGCFCGKSNYPGQPVDNIDKCCQEHDACYSHTSCAQIMIYILPYQWKCTDSGEAKCVYSLTETKTASEKCSYQLCECDRILGDCLKQYDCPANKPTCSHEHSSSPLSPTDIPKEEY